MLETDFNNAVKEIRMLVTLKAKECIGRGWSYQLVAEAPESYKDLKEMTKGFVVPIASYGSDQTIYDNHSVNTMFRFWHDVIHLEEDLGFGVNDESLVADIHIREGVSMGLSSLALDILEADTKGQVLYYDRFGEFVGNQKAFVQSCINKGMKNALRVRH